MKHLCVPTLQFWIGGSRFLRGQLPSSCFFLKSPVLSRSWLECQIFTNSSRSHFSQTRCEILATSNGIRCVCCSWPQSLLWAVDLFQQPPGTSLRINNLWFEMCECVHLTKWHQHIFSVSVKFGACYITGQWGEFKVKIATICLHKLFWYFFVVFHHKIFIKFLSFLFFFCSSLKFPQQNINQSEAWIGGFELSVELYGAVELRWSYTNW